MKKLIIGGLAIIFILFLLNSTLAENFAKISDQEMKDLETQKEAYYSVLGFYDQSINEKIRANALSAYQDGNLRDIGILEPGYEFCIAIKNEPNNQLTLNEIDTLTNGLDATQKTKVLKIFQQFNYFIKEMEKWISTGEISIWGPSEKFPLILDSNGQVNSGFLTYRATRGLKEARYVGNFLDVRLRPEQIAVGPGININFTNKTMHNEASAYSYPKNDKEQSDKYWLTYLAILDRNGKYRVFEGRPPWNMNIFKIGEPIKIGEVHHSELRGDEFYPYQSFFYEVSSLAHYISGTEETHPKTIMIQHVSTKKAFIWGENGDYCKIKGTFDVVTKDNKEVNMVNGYDFCEDFVLGALNNGPLLYGFQKPQEGQEVCFFEDNGKTYANLKESDKCGNSGNSLEIDNEIKINGQTTYSSSGKVKIISTYQRENPIEISRILAA
jgi:hypothetical protein